MIIENLKQIVWKNKDLNPLYLRNLLKERLQFYVLNYIYSSEWGESFLLKGGSCLRIFFQLPRLSEDLDLDILNENAFVLEKFLADLRKYFSKTLQYKDLGIKISGQENIIYLKFPLLDKLGLAKSKKKSKILFLRIDLAPVFGKKYQIELSVKSVDDFSFIVRRYCLADLFAGKIAAILKRTTKQGEEIEPRIKGRDYFDLVWFLENKTRENKTRLNFAYLKELTEIKTKKELKKLLIQKIKEMDVKALENDIQPLFRDQNFVKNFVVNYKTIAENLIIKRI